MKLLVLANAFFQWGPLASGRLARPPQQKPSSVRSSNGSGSIYACDESSTSEIIHRVQEIAFQRDWPISHVALAWLNRRVTSPIIGLSTPARMDEALDALGKELSEGEERYLEELYLPQKVQGHT